MKSETTSNDTIIWSFGVFSFLIFFVNFSLFFIVYWNSLKSFNNCTKGFARWYVKVPIFDIIALIGKSSTFLLISVLWTFAIPYNLLGEHLLENIFKWILCGSLVLTYRNNRWTFLSTLSVGPWSSHVNWLLFRRDKHFFNVLTAI